ncbi:3-isopropylmalate dehydrogenase [Streptomyces bauhiniae]|uniref:3-isopropylmalate dehydrogenase n=1 Tax=Streptomyces bauhiniae TaxID=2340725 RepID=A0A4Z1DFU6_9ACTN|nr:3-isopropylmalate dehydrogenase [Streptomyces bauhiniae]TGN81783.1 3-isopropylmalate dehydrogenase [Streptomyces bauhiniae]
MSRSIDLAVIPGDGIGQEVVTEGLKVLSAVLPQDVKLETKEYDFGARRYRATGETLTDADLDSLKAHDAILLGAIGDPSVPSGVLERGFLLKLRFAFDHHVNLRPSKLLPGVATPLAGQPEIDFVVVREGTEGPYTGNGGTIRTGTAQEVATEVSVNTAYGVERVVRDAFARAQARPRKKLTLVHKNNVLTFAGHLWTNIFNSVAEEYPEVTTEYIHVDAATIYLVTDPGRFDVIVTDNLFGDIITDLAAAVSGGIGVAASGNINPARTYPSMFEPVHGSAPDIAGQGKADPTATVLSVALLLRHLGYDAEADRVDAAVAADLTERADLPPRTTAEIGDALVGRVTG